MDKRGPKPKGKVKIEWSADFAYAIGLLVTDGNLSPDGRHLAFTSKDDEQIKNFMTALGIENKIGRKVSGYDRRFQPSVQFGDVLFYRFLLDIGLMPNKSRMIGAVKIPKEYFFDFLRGHLDGDGCFYSYYDPRWRSSFMFYTTFVSASIAHIEWLRSEIFKFLAVRGHITGRGNARAYQLKYAKAESLKILESVYYDKEVICLTRKREKILKALSKS